MIYAAVEFERRTERSIEVGQLIKLDPYATGDPRVWGVDVPPIEPGDGGIWATPALGDGHVYVTTHTGDLLTVDADTGPRSCGRTSRLRAASSRLLPCGTVSSTWAHAMDSCAPIDDPDA